MEPKTNDVIKSLGPLSRNLTRNYEPFQKTRIASI
jgi:hypothetical protein